MNIGVLLYYICFSQISSVDVVKVAFNLPITSDNLFLQTNNYILEIFYRVLEFVSLRSPSMSNILKCNEQLNIKNWLFGPLGLLWSHSETIIDSLMCLKNLENVNVPEQSGHPFSQSEVSLGVFRKLLK